MKGASQIAPFGLRMSEQLKEKVAARAARNGRSMNAEIVQILEDYVAAEESGFRTGDEHELHSIINIQSDLLKKYGEALKKAEQVFDEIRKSRE